MLYQPSFQFQLISDREYPNQISTLEQELKKYAIHDTLPSYDGCRLNYELYLTQHSHATIIIIHGLSEFYQKYYEMTWYFMNMGYNVCLYDQRGHGMSGRQIDGFSLIHVNEFDDYVKDLDCIIHQLVLPTCPDVPVYLYSHSMGGAVAALYLASDSSIVDRAILSSPMICASTYGIPLPLVQGKVMAYAKRDGWEARFPYSKDFNPVVQLSQTSDISEARFRHNLEYRIHAPQYQTSATTNRWMWEALRMQQRLLSPNVTAHIQADILLLNAGKDTTVKARPQQRFAKKIKHCTYQCFSEAKHTIYTASDDILQEYYPALLRFFSAPPL